MLLARPFERGPAAKSTGADLHGDECDEYVECFRHLEAQSTFTNHLHPDTGVFVPSVKEKLCYNASFFFFDTAQFHCGNRKGERRPTSSQMKNIITVGVERSIAPTMVPAKFHWQEMCGIYHISFQIFMHVTCTPAEQIRWHKQPCSSGLLSTSHGPFSLPRRPYEQRQVPTVCCAHDGGSCLLTLFSMTIHK